MKKMELKKQNSEQLKQFILQNQKDIVAEKIAIFTQQTTKNHIIKIKKKEIAIAKTILNMNREKNINGWYKKNQRQLLGTVIKNSGLKTVSVLVERKVKHPVYGKYVKKSRKYLVHDENASCKVGDTVVIFETKPFSKTKKFEVIY